jgi:hypothetical protein
LCAARRRGLDGEPKIGGNFDRSRLRISASCARKRIDRKNDDDRKDRPERRKNVKRNGLIVNYVRVMNAIHVDGKVDNDLEIDIKDFRR